MSRAILLVALLLLAFGRGQTEDVRPDRTGTENPKSWAFAPIERPVVPFDATRQETTHPIDAFVRVRLAAKDLAPSPAADRRTLMRRVAIDLTGLPPTFAEVTRFESDQEPRAYERLVDRLLASPRYGERQATHWLDIAHYADTHGFERDQKRANAYTYRDWVIRAFHRDLPYDEFLRLQIAGDVLRPDDPDAVIATGFIAAGPWDFVGQRETKNPVLNRAARADDLDDMITTVMTSTVALTVHCARCHDHKIDPISQLDYYRLASVFAGVERADRDAASRLRAEEDRRRAEVLRVIARTKRELGELRGDALDLADIAVGGSGFGDVESGRGLDPRTGKLAAKREGTLAKVVLNKFVASDFSAVDGLFVPDGSAPVVISSTGITVDDLPRTSGGVWDFVANAASLGFTSTQIDGVDYANAPHTILALHANKGVTFDLAAVRSAPGYERLRFAAAVGHGGAKGESTATLRIYVDGKLRFAKERMAAQEGGVRVDLSLDDSARFPHVGRARRW